MRPQMIKTLWISAVVIAALLGTIRFMKKNDYAHYGRDFTWYVDMDEKTGAERLVRGRGVGAIRQEIAKLVFALNKTVRESEQRDGQSGALEVPQLRLAAVEGGVARVEVINSEFLSQRMGSSGSQGFLAAATFTLTESPGINAVEFLFPAGEHAMPGTYSRETFSGFGGKPERTADTAGAAPATEQTTTAGDRDGQDRL